MTERLLITDAGDRGTADHAARLDDLAAATREAAPSVAVVGLGYVGLPTALALRARGADAIGIDINEGRLRAIRAQRVDLVRADRERLARELDGDGLRLTTSSADLAGADAVLICVPTPVDEHRNPDLEALRGACADVVQHAQPGQTIILTSTSYPGTTRELLVEPLAERGLEAGRNVFVAFSPERIDPGNVMPHEAVARVVGGATADCTLRAAAYLRLVTDHVIPVSSLEAAEMSKLLENAFRAVNIAFANEFADITEAMGLDAREVIDAAATKPYGFMPFYPGTGVGGHCIPCDPHYLLWDIRSRHGSAPILTEAMEAISTRPYAVVDRIARDVSATGRGLAGARILVVGVAYKPGVEDVRESPAVRIIQELLERDAQVDFFDPLVPSVRVDEQQILLSVTRPEVAEYDAVVVNTLHPRVDYRWLADATLLIDPSGRIRASRADAEGPRDDAPERRVAEPKVPFEVDG